MTDKSYVYYTFTDLENVTLDDLDAIKERQIDELSKIKKEKWALIAQILFYQNEIKKAREI